MTDIVVVSGITRTGTSLMTDMLAYGNPGYQVVSTRGYNNTKESLRNYNECRYTVAGVKADDAEYHELSHRIVKIVYKGLLQTDAAVFDTFRVILVMYRPWRDHATSFHAMRARHIRNVYKTRVKPAMPGVAFPEFLAACTEASGTNYALNYMDLMMDMATRGYGGKVAFVNFNQLLRGHVTLPLGLRLDPSRAVTRQAHAPIRHREFRPGFFAFLARLYEGMERSRVDGADVAQFPTWRAAIVDHLNQQAAEIKTKYNVSL